MVEERSSGGLNSLNMVIRETVHTLEDGRKQMFAVAENARNECTRLSGTLLEIDRQLEDVNRELDEIKTAFEGVRELQVRLITLEERRRQLANKKRELETSLASLRETAEKAEDMVAQVGVVMDFIRGNLRDINVRLESLHQKQQMGMQIIRAQEEERKRVAREIHDGPAQSMANVVLRMEFCEKLLDVEPEKVRGELQELKKIVRNNLQDVRKIIFDLRPMALDDLGVVPAVKKYIKDFREKYDINIEMTFRGKDIRLDSLLEIALFRLVQEALNNVAKHAHAANVRVAFEIRDHEARVMVEDDGVGFILERVLNNRSGVNFGLISMKERIDLLGGTMNIDTKPGSGTRILFTMPVKE